MNRLECPASATFRLRRGTVADAATVGSLFRRSFTATFGHLYPPSDLNVFLAECDDARFAGELADPAFSIVLAEAEGRLAGYVALGPQDLPVSAEGRWWVLRQLYLDRWAQGQGLGVALLEQGIEDSRRRGYDELYLTVYVDNVRARRLYERHGFEEVGAYAFLVGNTVDDDRIMRLKL